MHAGVLSEALAVVHEVLARCLPQSEWGKGGRLRHLSSVGGSLKTCRAIRDHHLLETSEEIYRLCRITVEFRGQAQGVQVQGGCGTCGLRGFKADIEHAPSESRI